jgi:hypothetical protein
MLGSKNVNRQSQNETDVFRAEVSHALSTGRILKNFHLFLHIKKHLAGKKFDDDDVVQEEVMTWFKWQAADFCDSGIQKLVPRLNKRLDNDGDYVEK